MNAMNPKGPWTWGLAVLVAVVLVSFWSAASVAQAIESTDQGELVFDIDNPDDMREVGSRSGIQIKDDIDTAIGTFECRRWARQFGVRPYRAVVSGTLPGRRLRVWICSGKADSRKLSELYCRELGMVYKRHRGSVVTCSRIGDA